MRLSLQEEVSFVVVIVFSFEIVVSRVGCFIRSVLKVSLPEVNLRVERSKIGNH